MYHPLQPDVLVRPDRPGDAGARVDGQLRAEESVALGVGCGGGGFAGDEGVGVDGAEFAVPDGGGVGELEGRFAGVLGFEASELGGGAGKRGSCREPHGGVIVQGVDAVGKDGGEALPFASEGVAVEPEDVVGVDGADGGFDAGVECGETEVLWVAGLVDRIVARDPGIISVAGRELLPQPDCAVLVILVVLRSSR